MEGYLTHWNDFKIIVSTATAIPRCCFFCVYCLNGPYHLLLVKK
jgi:hypothetical protein